MTRAPLVMGKAQEPFQRSAEIYDTTLGWRFVNPLLKAQYGVDSMAETGENVAEEYQVSRADQDAFAVRSQQRAGRAMAAGYFAEEIVPVEVPGGKGGPVKVDKDEHPRPETTLEGLSKLKPIVRNPGTITAGNASGINDGAAAVILASAQAAQRHGLTPRARVLGMASAAVPPRVMGIGPVPSTRKLMARLGLKIGDFDLIEINEAFASQGLACLRQLGVADDAEHVNPHGGAIALGHPLGMSGARIALTAVHGLEKRGGRRALATMCVDVGRAFRSRSSGSARRSPTHLFGLMRLAAWAEDQTRKETAPVGNECRIHSVSSQSVEAEIQAAGRRGRCALPRVRTGSSFPYAPERKYTPCDAPKEKLFALRDYLGFDKNVIVQASCHSKDNRAHGRCARRLERQGQGRRLCRRGSHRQGTQVDARPGVRGVRFNFVKRLVDFTPRPDSRASRRDQPLGWHVVIYFEMPDLAGDEEFFTSLPTTVVFDHMGTPDVTKGVDAPTTSGSIAAGDA